MSDPEPLRRHVARRSERLLVPALLVIAAATLVLGLSLPILQVEKFVFWESRYSVVTGVAGLFEDGELLLGFVILLFSIVFPIAKLGLLAAVWWARFTHEQRFGVLRLLERVGRWSMLDVFAVAILVVAGKLGAVADVEARAGIYLFATAILLSFLATALVRRSTVVAARGSPPSASSHATDEVGARSAP